MTITVRNVRHGCTVVRLTGAHARLLNGLVADMLGSAPGLAQVGELTTLPAHVEPVAPAQDLVPVNSSWSA